jgi:ankyrin repeat protein/serine/threonine protein kinase
MRPKSSASADSDGVVAALASAWDSAPPAPDLSSLVSDAVRVNEGLLVSLVRLDAEKRLHRGQPVQLEHYARAISSEAVAPGSALTRIVLCYERLAGVSAADARKRLGDAYAADIEAVFMGEPSMPPTDIDEDPGASEPDSDPDAEAWAYRWSKGDRLGPYRLRKRLGAGAFGEVWLADRRAPDLLVAIKVLKPGVTDEDSLRRFEVEAQALAFLEHQYIAKIHGAGMARGLPYIAMEYVEGKPLTQYCDDRRMPLEQRLELMVRICEGMQHAHQRQLIHRDLKPDNILVTEVVRHPSQIEETEQRLVVDERDGNLVVAVPKILDFGLAKAAEKSVRLSDGTLTSDLGKMMGTPVYMAPEQAGHRPNEVTQKADIFSLGVILFEMLSGTLPLPKERLCDLSREELVQTLRDLPRPELEVRFGEVDDETRRMASHRRGDISAEDLARRLRGRARHLCGKALRLEPDKRFSSVAALGRDIRNYLEDRDFIEAAAEPRGDRVLRHVRKNRLPYAAAAAVFTALVVGIAGTTVQWRRAEAATVRAEEQARIAEGREQEAREARREADSNAGEALQAKARAEGELAAKTEAFRLFSETIARARPSSGNPASLTIREVLAGASEQIQQRPLDVVIKAELLLTIGSTLDELGLQEDAVKALRALQVLIDGNLTQPTEGDGAVSRIGDLRLIKARGLREVVMAMPSEDPESLKLMTESVRIFDEVLGAEHEETIRAKVELAGLVKSDQGAEDRWEKVAGRWLPVVAGLLGRDSEELRTEMLRRLEDAEHLMANGEREKSVEQLTAFGKPLAARLGLLAQEIPRTLLALAGRQWDLKQENSAEACVRASLELLESIYPPKELKRVVDWRMAASLLIARGHASEAAELLRKSWKLSSELLGVDAAQTRSIALDYLQTRALCGAYETILQDAEEMLPANLYPKNSRWHWLAQIGYIDAVRCALLQGMDPNIEDDEGRTILHATIVDFRANDPRPDNPLYSSRPPAVSYTEAISRLVGLGMDPNRQNSKGATAMHFAAVSGRIEAYELLKTLGANATTPEVHGWTPLHEAVALDRREIADALIKDGVDVEARTKDGRTPMHLACRAGSVPIVRSLLGSGATFESVSGLGLAPIHDVACSGSVELLNLAVDAGARIDSVDNEGWSTLHHAADWGRIDIIRRLLELRAPIGSVDKRGETPLHQAGFKGQLDAVLMLIKSGASVDAQSNDGRTPLHYASLAARLDVAAALLDAGANIEARDSEGTTPLISVLRGLRENRDSKGILRLLLQRGADKNARQTTRRGWSALHWAANQPGTLELIELLLEAGVDVDIRAADGSTPLHATAVSDKHDLSRNAERLIQRGASIHARNKLNHTPADYHTEDSAIRRILLGQAP